MSDQMPVSDLESSAGPWTCPRCGRENKAAWTTCPGCESGRDGRPPSGSVPDHPARRTGGLNVLLGVLVLAALVGLVVWLAPTVWEWVAEQATTFWDWVDSRT